MRGPPRRSGRRRVAQPVTRVCSFCCTRLPVSELGPSADSLQCLDQDACTQRAQERGLYPVTEHDPLLAAFEARQGALPPPAPAPAPAQDAAPAPEPAQPAQPAPAGTPEPAPATAGDAPLTRRRSRAKAKAAAA